MSSHRMQGYSGSNYDRQVERTVEQSTFHKMKETYWVTKQAVMKKLGKKEDEHIVASDSELDAKIELFRAIQRSSMELLRAIEKYQDRLCALSQEENAMGRFLKSTSQQDKTRAGKMMGAVGKSQSFSSQQRLALRVPLVRLYQEVETFRYRAISDTLVTINRMEGARTEYRGALLWMKDVSEELNPDAFKQLEKFRKVQAQVRQKKARFDKLKLDTMQKIDLLAASRCNMFSHVLANYQSTLLHFWEKTARTMSAVAESFKGYQYYEFNMLKELAEPSKKLAEQKTRDEAERDTDEQTDHDPEGSEEGEGSKSEESQITEIADLLGSHDIPGPTLLDQGQSTESSSNSSSAVQQPQSAVDLLHQSPPDLLGQNDFGDFVHHTHSENQAQKESLINWDNEYHDDVDDDKDKDSLNNLLDEKEMESMAPLKLSKMEGKPFIDLGEDEDLKRAREESDFSGKIISTSEKKPKSKGAKDLLSDNLEPDDSEKDDMTLLNEILNAPSTGEDDFSREWQAVFGATPMSAGSNFTPVERDQEQQFMPSNLLDMTSQMSAMRVGQDMGAMQGMMGMMPPGARQMGMPSGAPMQQQPQTPSQGPQPKPAKKGQKADMSAWFNLFADLDPLSNPDAIGKREGEITDA